MDLSLMRSTMNTVNSVIGVSVLAMPFCFNQCGFILGIFVLIFVAYVTYLSSCQLLQLANFHKKRSYEFLAMHVFGAPGKLIVELSMIGLMMGTFVAFFVIIGDLAPEIARDLFGMKVTPSVRALFLIALGSCVVVPLSLQKNIDNLSSFSAISLLFYFSLLLHIIAVAFQRTVDGKSDTKMVTWNPGGIFKCMPIMSMSFGCQTQLFVIYDTLSDPNIKTMKSVIRATLATTATVYIGVGLSGYVSYVSPTPLPGDILILYENTVLVNCLKLGFVFSVAISFPLLIFPLRASIYSLLFLRKGPTTDLSGESTVLMPDHRFRWITISIVLSTLTCGILVPNVEFVLALTGSVTGSVIFFILPSSMFIKSFGFYSQNSSASQTQRRPHTHACVVLAVGLCVMIIGSIMAVEDQKIRTENLKITKAVHDHEVAKNAEKVIGGKDGAAKIVAPKSESGNANGKAALPPDGVHPDSGGVAARKEPANPDKPAVNIFINSSKSKSDERKLNRPPKVNPTPKSSKIRLIREPNRSAIVPTSRIPINVADAKVSSSITVKSNVTVKKLRTKSSETAFSKIKLANSSISSQHRIGKRAAGKLPTNSSGPTLPKKPM